MSLVRSLSSLLSASTALVLSSSHRRDLEPFCKKWINPRIFVTIDNTLAVPLGYAAYRIYKNGGGFDNTETATALVYYGVNMIACVATFFNSKKIDNFEIFVYAIINSSAVAAALAFFKIDSVAGYCLAPYAVWTGFYFMLASYLRNKEEK